MLLSVLLVWHERGSVINTSPVYPVGKGKLTLFPSMSGKTGRDTFCPTTGSAASAADLQGSIPEAVFHLSHRV
jgi:hypothetical protein